ncbi:RHS repeat domain-containing protein [Pedobacter sp. MW01-1-1]|uniref:RHS repeat domain-containing protein n=1 Tax=Pedobacter sp. MW01-1-1 TaxID=3383027 RepID=UPI003FEE87E5
MIRLFRWVLFYLLFQLSCVLAYGAVEPYENFLKGSIKAGDSVLVKDEKFRNPLFNWNDISNISVNNSITFQLLDENTLSQSFTAKIKFRVEYFSSPSQTALTRIDTVTLSIAYDKNSGAIYKSKDSYFFQGGFDVRVYVLEISSPEFGTNLPAVFQLSNQINIDRTYAFKPYLFLGINGDAGGVSGGGMAQRFSAGSGLTENNRQLALSWTPLLGAQEYDIEWVAVDADGDYGALVSSLRDGNYIYDSDSQLAQLFRHNATRITTHEENYRISLIHNSNFIVVRMRQVAYVDGLRNEGVWFYKQSDNTTYAIWEIFWHQSNLNWQYSATYAEDGKKKEVVSYFDGTLRGRQTATLNSSDNIAVVQENVYDKFGRVSASILPAPVKESETGFQTLHYFPTLNTNSSGLSYSFADLSLANCELTPSAMGIGSGAGKYYSNQNQFISAKAYNAYIPNAGGYPLSVTQYTPDNTGRIAIQGGVGQVFQPGQTEKHTTRYFYDKPTQWELDRLFGNDVGYANHYLKNTVIDPNGQISISYLNASGKTIATALSGDTPENLDALPNKEVAQMLPVNLLNPEQFTFKGDELNLTATASYTSSFAGNATLSYDVEKLINQYQINTFSHFSNCYYNLRITVKDDCGNLIYNTPDASPIAIGSKTLNTGAAGTETGVINLSFNKIGTYFITFNFKLDEKVIENYTNDFISTGQANGTLKKKSAFILQQLNNANFIDCFSDCKTARSNLGTLTEFTSMFNARLGALGEQNNLVDYATYISGLYTSISNYISTTIEPQCLGTSVASCDVYKKPMLEDVSPGGQYAPLDANGVLTEPAINVLQLYFKHGAFDSPPVVISDDFKVTNEQGQIVTPYDANFTLADLVKYWQPIWAEMFLPFHPEYCKLQFCGQITSSKKWDDELNEKTGQNVNYHSNNATNFLLDTDPFFAQGSVGGGEKLNMAADLALYSSNVMGVSVTNKSLSQVVDYLIYCSNGSPYTDNWTSCSVSCRVEEREWEMYRSMYLDLKNKYIDKVRKATTCASACVIGVPVTLPGSNSTGGTSCASRTLSSDMLVLSSTSYRTFDYANNQQKTYSYVAGVAGAQPSSAPYCAMGSVIMQFYPCIDVNYQSNTIRYTNVWEIVCTESIPNSCANSGSILVDGYEGGVNQFYIDWGSYRTVFTVIEGYPPSNPPEFGCNGDLGIYYYDCFTVNNIGAGLVNTYTNAWVAECSTYYWRASSTVTAKSTTANTASSSTLEESAASTPRSVLSHVLAENIVADSTHTHETVLAELKKLTSTNVFLEADVTKGNVLLISKVNPTELTFTGDTAVVLHSKFGSFSHLANLSIKKGKGSFRSFQNVWVAKFIPETGSLQVWKEAQRVIIDSLHAIKASTSLIKVNNSTENELKTTETLKGNAKTLNVVSVEVNPYDCQGTDFEISGPLSSCYGSGNPGYRFDIYPADGVPVSYQPYLFVDIYINHAYDNGFDVITTVHLDPETNSGSVCIPEGYFQSGLYLAPYVCGLTGAAEPQETCPAVYTTKISRFENVDYSSSAPNATQYNSNLQTDFASQALDICTSNAEAWVQKLDAGLAMYGLTGLRQQLKDNLISICALGADQEHPFGASNVRAGVTGITINGHTDCRDFASVLKYTLGLSTFNKDINPWLIDGVYANNPNAKQQATTVVISATSAAICTKLTTLTNEAASVGQTLFTYLQNKYGAAMTLSQQELTALQTSCASCNYLLNYDLVLPVFLQPDSKGCLTKAEFDADKIILNNELGGTLTAAGENYESIITNFFNNKYGFSVGYDQYKTLETGATQMLCNTPPFVSVPEDVYTSARSLVNVAFGQGEQLYNAYIIEERNNFISAYISKSASAKANVHLTAKKEVYHYTLYYYDLAGNLVRTVPPEGVVLLNDAEVTEVGRTRDGLTSLTENCTYQGPSTLSDRNTALQSVSTALLSTGNAALELWMYSSSTGARQFIAATPDMKYLIQTCQNGNLLNVDIFTLNQTASNNVAITLSNHVTANVSALLPLQPWTHVVVQGTDLSRGALQLWINGKQYNPVAGAPSAGGSWAITSDASGNIVMPDNFSMLKFLRVYPNRVLGADEIAKNAASSCFGVVDVSNPYQYRFNVPAPGSATTIAANSTQETQFTGVYPAHVLTTTYTYNATNQVVQQSTPDAGTSNFWYDRLSRLIGSQNAKQAQTADYSYTQYDALGRIAEVGQKRTTWSIAAGYLEDGQVSTFLNGGSNSQITTTVYDAASTMSGTPSGMSQGNLRKRVSASIYRDTYSDTNFSASYYDYDFTGNVKTLYQKVKGLGLKRLDYEYDLVSGKVNFLAYQKYANDEFYYQYEYDAENRLTKAWIGTQANLNAYGFGSTLTSPNRRLQASYQYYLHGPLARMELGAEGTLVQGVDYAYTLQGWLKGINGTALGQNDMGNDGATIAKDALAYSLGYYQGDYSPVGGGSAFGHSYQASNANAAGRNLYNGNISNSTYAIENINNGATVGYTYGYDQLNRLKTMNQQNLGSSGNWSYDGASVAFRENFNYDANGNILTLQRNKGNGSLMDNLTYTYSRDANGRLQHNKLQSVSDSQGINNGGDMGSSNYTYDAIGNLTGDAAEGISDIQWSVYGKIKQINKNSGNIVYNYDASGNRISKTANGLTTWYVRDAQGNALALYDNAGGTNNWREQTLYGSSRLGIWKPNINLVSQNGGSVWNLTGRTAYELSNHLGNTMATISDNRVQVSGGYKADVLTAGDYYAFGMAMTDRSYTASGATAYRYGFNGKENDAEVNGQQDYGMRIYDSRLGRFKSVDPISKSYPHLTPYQFSSNNPILNVDLDGLEGVDYLKNIVVRMDGNSVFPKSDLKNTDSEEIFVRMNYKTVNIIHSTPNLITKIEFNPSSVSGAAGIWWKYGADKLLAAQHYSKNWVRFTDTKLPAILNKATGVEQNAAGFANTFRHYSWQALLTASNGKQFAKDIGDYHEADGLTVNSQLSAQNFKGYIKDNIIDLTNNHYARMYGEKIDFKKVISSIDNYTDFLNGVAKHIATTVDGYKNDKSFDGIRNGSVKLFDKKDKDIQEQFRVAQGLEGR